MLNIFSRPYLHLYLPEVLNSRRLRVFFDVKSGELRNTEELTSIWKMKPKMAAHDSLDCECKGTENDTQTINVLVKVCQCISDTSMYTIQA